jgi:ankyrin repeat protein
LLSAAQRGDVIDVKTLIANEKDIDVDQVNASDGATAVYIAAFNGHNNVIKALAEAGAHVNFPNEEVSVFDVVLH